jgi:hypothetical protein
MAAKKQNFVILQGETFQRVIRWETLPYIYKAISAITQAAPVQITSSSHGLVSGWRAAVVSVRGMSEINAKYSPPRESEFKQVTRISDNSLSINDVNSSDFSAYASGGYLQYFTPVDLSGYTAKMEIKDRVGGTVLLTLGSEVVDDPQQRITLDNANHTINLSINATDTAALTWTKGVYDLELTGPTGAVTRIFTGSVSVSKEVTT